MKSLLFIILVFSAPLFSGEQTIYVWTDDKGKKHYSQRPPPDRKYEEKNLTIKEGKKPAKATKGFDPKVNRPVDAGVCNLATRRYIGQWQAAILQRYRETTATCERMKEIDVLRGSLQECYDTQEKVKEDEMALLRQYKQDRECR